MRDTSKWIYIYSEILKQEIAINKKNLWVYCKDGVKYSPEEYKIIQEHGQANLQVHILKSMFDGKIVK